MTMSRLGKTNPYKNMTTEDYLKKEEAKLRKEGSSALIILQLKLIERIRKNMDSKPDKGIASMINLAKTEALADIVEVIGEILNEKI